jgi:multiple sugar transport system substrate-binding protein
LLLAGLACGEPRTGRSVVTFPGSAVGAEAELLARQIARFAELHPGIHVEQRPTPDAADQRHQLYVQWLNAGASDPDVLQLDVIWTPEFAAAGWILDLARFDPELGDFFPAMLRANRVRGSLHALPWFADVGMLYWRSDLLDAPPDSFEELATQAREALQAGRVARGFVWQGARYEGLVTVFLEYLGGFGGRILDDAGQVDLDSPEALRALEAMRLGLETEVVPREVLGWQEEQVRFAFQNGEALFMRNWPYAYPLLQDAERSKVAGRFAVAPMPSAAGGRPTASLGGSQLAINARSDVPEAAWSLVEYLTRPEQMLERARVAGQLPTRPSLFANGALEGVLAVPPAEARRVIEAATPRPVTPLYTELSAELQVRLHRALSGQQSPAEALREANLAIRNLLARSGWDGG